MSEVERALYLLDCVMNYYTLQLGRCAVFSMLLIALILILRRICSGRVFGKGLLWSLLLLAPFIGRLRAFYEKGPLFLLSWRWISICMSRFWLSQIYFVGIILIAAGIFWHRWKINCFVKSLRETQIAGTRVRVCETAVTPFTTGVFRPRIVVPELMLEQYPESDLKMILLHEKMHIRLGHLFFYLLWDILHALLWVNPLFGVCLKYFKEDMEDICDSVTMQRGESTGYEYGSLLLKSIKLLQCRALPADVELPFAFAGEDEFRRIRQRVKTVAGHRGYRRIAVYGMAGIALLAVGVSLAGIRLGSYARYQEMDDVRVYDYVGTRVTLLLEDCGELRDAVSLDGEHLYVDSEKLLSMLDAQNVTSSDYVIAYGGFYKLPGYGGGGGCEFVDREMLKQGDLKLPRNEAEDPLLWIFKRL